MNNTLQKRSSALDLIRCMACFFVVSAHFFKYSEFNGGPIRGAGIYVMMMLRTLVMTCVPLFMVLSGYLMHDRKISRRYFGKLTKTLGVYVLASLVCALFRNLTNTDPLSFQQTVRGILEFTAAPYSWYVEMYIGLFLLVPFLNVLYQNLENKKQKQLLLGVLLFSTALPSIGNIWCFLELEWWLDPTIPMAHYKLVPQWWEEIYPITYYFIGCYLREFPLKLKRSVNLVLIVLVMILSGSYCYWRSYNTYFIFGLWQNNGSVAVVSLTVLVFSLLAALPMEKTPRALKQILARFSDWSLGAYLVSWIFDVTVYKVLNAHVPAMPERMPWFLVTVPLIFLCSMALSAVLTTVTDLLLKAVRHRK